MEADIIADLWRQRYITLFNSVKSEAFEVGKGQSNANIRIGSYQAIKKLSNNKSCGLVHINKLFLCLPCSYWIPESWGTTLLNVGSAASASYKKRDWQALLYEQRQTDNISQCAF